MSPSLLAPYKLHPIVRTTVHDVVPDDMICIHGKYYAAKDIDHPGGKAFIAASRGTDATLLFESSHLNIDAAKMLLERLPIRGNGPKNPTNFDSYARLRKTAFTRYPSRQSRAATRETLQKFNIWFFLTVTSYAMLLYTEPFTVLWILCCVASAVTSTVLGGMGHNFLHRLDIRAAALDWNGLSSFEWLLEHIVSHHPHPNTTKDHDSISMLPFVRWLPSESNKATWEKILNDMLLLLIFFVGEIAVAIQGNLGHRCRWNLPHEMPRWMAFAPWLFVFRLVGILVTHGLYGIVTILFSLSIASFYFSFLAHLNHCVGAAQETNDFVQQQLCNTIDLPSFGPYDLGLDRQTLHHLFPTLDHSRIDKFFRDSICLEFNKTSKKYFEAPQIRELTRTMFHRVNS